MKTRTSIIGALALLAVLVGATAFMLWPRSPWTAEDVSILRALWIGSLPPLPPDPSNQYADDPRAVALGHKLFFDTRFSANGEVSCGTCHRPGEQFQDGIPLGKGVGTTDRRTMTIVGAAYSPWLFWDGRKDSLWAQALGPLESPVEHGANRTFYAHLINQHYQSEYEAIFGQLPALDHLPEQAGPLPDPDASAAWHAMTPADREAVTRIYVNMGKAIAAYERRILPGPARFDRYVEAVLNNDQEAIQAALTADEVAGLRLFIGKANCVQCHNGPLFTDNVFHNTGVPAVPELPEDTGRTLGVKQVLVDEFNCLSSYSDATPEECAELRFTVVDDHRLERAFKPPTLRNVDGRGPFMHAGQFATLEQVLDHYNRAPAASAGHSELEPLNLTGREIDQLLAFLKTLSGPLNAPPELLAVAQ